MSYNLLGSAKSTRVNPHADDQRFPPSGRPLVPDVPAFAYGDREALYTEFAPLVKRLQWKYGQNQEMRQELTGEIYCRFCALWDAYDPQRGVPLRPYLVRQLTTTAYTYARKQWTIDKREVCKDWSREDGLGDLGDDPTASWLRNLSQQALRQSLPEAIAQLPPQQRKVVYWRYYEDLSFDTMAELLCVKPVTVRSLLRHGLNNLRKSIGEGGLGGENAAGIGL